MRGATVKNVSSANPVADSRNTTCHLRDHAPVDSAVADELLKFVRGGLSNERCSISDVAPKAIDIGEIHQLLCAERGCNLARHGVGVDIECLPFGVGTDRRDNRYEFIVEQPI